MVRRKINDTFFVTPCGSFVTLYFLDVLEKEQNFAFFPMFKVIFRLSNIFLDKKISHIYYDQYDRIVS